MATPPADTGAKTPKGGAPLGILTVVMTLLGWCSVPLFIEHFSHRIDVWTSNGWRYGFSALLWLPVILWGWWKKSLPNGLWRASITPALFNSCGQVCFALAFYNADPTMATFGLRLNIVFAAVGAYLLFPSERAMLKRPAAWFAMVMVLGGVIGTIFAAEKGGAGPGTRGVPEGGNQLLGIGFAIVSSLMFALYGLAVRRRMHGYHPVTAFAAINQYTALIIVPLMLIFGRNFGADALDLGTDQFGLLLLSSVIGIALGHVFYYISIARLGVAVSSGVIQLQPFGVALGAWMLYGKLLTPVQITTGLVAVGGAVLLLYVQWQTAMRLRAAGAAAAAASRETVAPEAERDHVAVAGASATSMESADLDAMPLEERTAR